MQCLECGNILGPYDRVCMRCGRPASVQPQAAPPPVMSIPHKVCPICGQPAVAHMPACGRCGHRYVAAPRLTSSKTPVIAIVLVCLVIVALASIAILATSRRSAAFRNGGNGLLVMIPAKGGHGAGVTDTPAVDSGQIGQRLTSATATMGGDVEVTLAWNSTSDLDLEVRDPKQELVTAYHPNSQSGGVMDVDANPTGLTPEGTILYLSGKPPGAQNVLPLPDAFFDMGAQISAFESLARMGGALGSDPESGTGRNSKVPSLYTRKPVEHIYFAHAPAGVYTVYASCFSWREKTLNPLPFTIEVRSRGQVVQSITGAIGPRNYCADGAEPIIVCQFVVR